MIHLQTFCWNPFHMNSYLICNQDHEGWLIDAGLSTRQEFDELRTYLTDNKINLTRVLLTHGHIDHVCGCSYLFDHYGLLPELNQADHFLYHSAGAQAEMFGLKMNDLPEIKSLDPGNLDLGSVRVEAIPLPGHSPGSLGFFLPGEKILFSGDVIFRQSIGRTDLPGGDYGTLLQSIRTGILDRMDADTRIYPGHGPETDVGREVLDNPFLTGNSV